MDSSISVKELTELFNPSGINGRRDESANGQTSRSSSRLAVRHNASGENWLSEDRYLEAVSQTCLVMAARQSEMPAGMLIP